MGETAIGTAELDCFFQEFYEFIDVQNDLKKTTNDYNLITALLNQSDEVRLHSRFIYSLINPKGKHYNGTLFLEKFLNIIGVENFNYEAAEVKKEYENIDIYITDGNQHIIVENKIHACDQNKQISRYIKTIEDSSDDEAIFDNLIVVYLTLNHKKPSYFSLDEWHIIDNHLHHKENNKYKIKYVNCTYKTDIINWINSLSQDTNEILANVRQAITSYKDVVEKMTHIKGSNVMGINDYLLKPENFEKLLVAASLVNSFKSISGKLLKQFFVNLDDAVDCRQFAEKYQEEEIKPFRYDYRDNNCDKWFTGKRQKSTYDIGTFFKINNKPIAIGLMVSVSNLYFIVRVIGDDNIVEQLLKDVNILDNKYKCWDKIKSDKDARLKLYCKPFNYFYKTSVDYNIYNKINQKSILDLLCKKESIEKIAEKMNGFANELSGIRFPEKQ